MGGTTPLYLSGPSDTVFLLKMSPIPESPLLLYTVRCTYLGHWVASVSGVRGEYLGNSSQGGSSWHLPTPPSRRVGLTGIVGV